MRDIYFWLTRVAYKMILHHNKKFGIWCVRHTKWLKKWKEKYGVEVE